jgi:hypothetical protein
MQYESFNMAVGDHSNSSPIPSTGRSQTSPKQTSALWTGLVSRFGARRRLQEPGYKLFWQTVAIVASMLVFIAIRPPREDVAGGPQRSITSEPRPEDVRTVAGARAMPAGALSPSNRLRSASDHSSAKASLNGVTLHAGNIARKSDFQDAPDGAIHKRVVVN